MARSIDPFLYAEEGARLLAQFRQSGDLKVLASAAAHLRHALNTQQTFRDRSVTHFVMCITARELAGHTHDADLLRESVFHGDIAARSLSTNQPGYANGMINLGKAALELAKATSDQDALNKAVQVGQWSVRYLPSNHPLKGEALVDYARTLRLLFDRTRNTADLHESARIGRLAIRELDPQSALADAFIWDQANTLIRVHTEASIQSAIDEAIALSSSALRMYANRPTWAHHAANLATAILNRLGDRNDKAQLQEAVQLLRSAASQRQTGRNRTYTLLMLTRTLERLAIEEESIGLAAEAIDVARACWHESSRNGDWSAAVVQFLRSTWRLSSLLVSEALMREAIDIGFAASRVKKSTSDAALDGYLGLLLVRLNQDSPGTDRELDLLRTGAREAYIVGERRLFLYALYTCLRTLHNRDGSRPALQEALTVIGALVDSGELDPAHLQLEYRISLGSTLIQLHRVTGSDTLSRAIEILENLRVHHDLTPALRSQILDLLSVAYGGKGSRTTDLGLIQHAVDLSVGAIEQEPTVAAYHSNLSHHMLALYDLSGNPKFLYDALQYARQALVINGSDEAVILTNLGLALRGVYRLDRDPATLNEAVGVFRRSVIVAERGGADLSVTYYNAAVGLRDVYYASRLVEIGREASALSDKALQAIDQRSDEYSLVLAQSGMFEAEDAERTRDLNLADAAVNKLEACIRGRTGSRLGLVTCHLGSAWAIRASLSHDAQDTLRALSYLRSGAKDPGARPMWIRVRLEIIRILLDPNVQAAVPHWMDEIESISDSIDGMADARPKDRLHAFHGRGLAYAQLNHWKSAARYFALAIELLSDVAAPHLDLDSQLSELTGNPSLIADGVACAVRAEDSVLAVRMLEVGRARLISRVLDWDVDLERLETSHPDLSKEFLDAQRAIGLLSEGGQIKIFGADVLQAIESVQRRAAQVTRLKEASRAIRSCDGFADFYRARDPEQLAAELGEGAAIYLNASTFGIHAVCLRGSGATALELPLDSSEELLRQTQRMLDLTGQPVVRQDDLKELLDWTRRCIVAPALSLIQHSAGRGHRVWWCPTGPFSYLPLHASVAHHESDTLTTNDIVSSYVPTLSQVSPGRRGDVGRGSIPNSKTLIVGVSRTPNVDGELAYVDEEVRRIGKLCDSMVLREKDATRSQVMEGLEKASSVHFACHSLSDWEDPLSSRIILWDHQSAPLDVRHWIRARLGRRSLAFLSSCSSAQVSFDRSDESLSVAVAMQAVVFDSVVATLWSVDDYTAMLVAESFYAIRSENPDLPSAKVLHSALTRAAARHDTDPTSIAAFIHVGY